jgi:hypothetical protein
MGKKTYIVLKRGILDKRHIFRINTAIWLYLYMLDIVGWDEGIIYEWKDKDAAEELGFSISTIRNQRRNLDELDYISCLQHPRGLQIKIKNWTNPREYSGKVYNQKKESVKELTPSIVESVNQSDTLSDSGLTPFIYLKEQRTNDPLRDELELKWNAVKNQLCSGLPFDNRFRKDMEYGNVIGIHEGNLNVSVDDPESLNERLSRMSVPVMQAVFNDGTKLNFVCKEE